MYKRQTRSFGGSTLDGVFKKISLRGFSNEDLQEYFNKFDSLQIKLSDDIKKKILYYGEMCIRDRIRTLITGKLP